MKKPIDTLVGETKSVLEQTAEVEEGTHYNEKVARGVPLPKHLYQKAADSIKKSYEAHHHTLLGKKTAGEAHHGASAAHFDAAHALKEAGFAKLAKHHLALSHHHRRCAISK